MEYYGIEEEAKQLSMLVKKRIQYLRELDSKAKKEIKHAPKGQIRVSRSNHTWQYIIRIEDSEKKRDLYVKKKDNQTIRKLVQKGYCMHLDKSIQDELALMTSLMHTCEKILTRDKEQTTPEYVYAKEHEAKKPYITSYLNSREERIEKWKQEPYERLFYPGDQEREIWFVTDNKENVRSKSEALIANKLLHNHVPYKYEKKLILESGKIVYPDFTVMNTRTMQEIYIEHLGMMDDPEYVQNAMSKIRNYEDNHILLGDQLLVTYETRARPLNIERVEEMIQKFMK